MARWARAQKASSAYVGSCGRSKPKLAARGILLAWTEKPALIGLASGGLFGVAAVCYRAASLSLESGDFVIRAGFTLLCVLSFQTVVMAAYLALKDPNQILQVVREWRWTIWVGLAGMLGSAGWFTAMTLQNAAYVRALGQIEVTHDGHRMTQPRAQAQCGAVLTPTDTFSIAIRIPGLPGISIYPIRWRRWSGTPVADTGFTVIVIRTIFMGQAGVAVQVCVCAALTGVATVLPVPKKRTPGVDLTLDFRKARRVRVTTLQLARRIEPAKLVKGHQRTSVCSDVGGLESMAGINQIAGDTVGNIDHYGSSVIAYPLKVVEPIIVRVVHAIIVGIEEVAEISPRRASGRAAHTVCRQLGVGDGHRQRCRGQHEAGKSESPACVSGGGAVCCAVAAVVCSQVPIEFVTPENYDDDEKSTNGSCRIDHCYCFHRMRWRQRAGA